MGKRKEELLISPFFPLFHFPFTYTNKNDYILSSPESFLSPYPPYLVLSIELTEKEGEQIPVHSR